MKKIILGQKFLDTVLESVEIKDSMSTNAKRRFLMRAAASGVIVLLAYVGYIAINANFGITNEMAITSGKFISSAFFTLALLTIYYTKSELLTSNMMMTSVALYFNKITFKSMFKIMGLCYLGNLLGGIAFGLILSFSSLVTQGATQEYLIHLVDIKTGYVANGEFLDLFIRAILCNFFINLSMLMVYSGNIKDDFGKFLAMFFGVFMFCYLGLEHSVANTVLFVYAYFYEIINDVNVINEIDAIINVIIALIGNFIGGGLLIGYYYAFINDGRKLKED